jgi:hypothetical protein
MTQLLGIRSRCRCRWRSHYMLHITLDIHSTIWMKITMRPANPHWDFRPNHTEHYPTALNFYPSVDIDQNLTAVSWSQFKFVWAAYEKRSVICRLGFRSSIKYYRISPKYSDFDSNAEVIKDRIIFPGLRLIFHRLIMKIDLLGLNSDWDIC